MRFKLTILFLFVTLQTWAIDYAWNGTVSSQTSNSLNWTPAGLPTITSNITFLTNNNITINATLTCLSINFGTYTGTLTMNANWTCGSGAITLSSGMTIVYTSGTFTYQPGASGASLNSNGKAFPIPITFNGSSGATITIGSGNNWIQTGAITFTGLAVHTFNTTTSEQLEIQGNWTSGAGTSGVATNGTATFLVSGTASTISSGANTALVENNMTINSSGTVTIGNFYFGAATFTYTAGTMNFTGTFKTFNTTISTTSTTFNLSSSINFSNVSLGVGTVTINTSILNVTGTLNCVFTVTSSTTTFAGNKGWTAASFSTSSYTGAPASNNMALTVGNTYTITNSMNSTNFYSPSRLTIKSATGGTPATLNLSSAATCNNGYLNFTDIDASGGRTITTFAGTLSNTTNIVSLTDWGGYAVPFGN